MEEKHINGRSSLTRVVDHVEERDFRCNVSVLEIKSGIGRAIDDVDEVGACAGAKRSEIGDAIAKDAASTEIQIRRGD
jgi:hypothetical protein